MSSENNPVFISRDRKIYTGEDAIKLLRRKNDSIHLDDEKGIVKVDVSRWKEAQDYERRTWMVDLSHYKEDRNSIHKMHFDNYSLLEGRDFHKAIELGCGPFTNIRHIAEVSDIKECHLLDPLIEEYINHPNCTYRSYKFRIRNKRHIFKRYRYLPVIIHNDTIEEFSIGEKFDLVVMVNVIEHCFDAELIFKKILQITGNGAVFVFHERYYSVDTLHEQLNYEYDAGHPLKVDRKRVDKFLLENFSPMLNKAVHFERRKWGGDRSYDGIYFIGRRI